MVNVTVPTIAEGFNLTSLPVPFRLRGLMLKAVSLDTYRTPVVELRPLGNGGDFVINGDGSSNNEVQVKVLADKSEPYAECNVFPVRAPNTCALSTFFHDLIEGALNNPLTPDMDENTTLLDADAIIQFTNAVTGQPQLVTMSLRLFDESEDVQVPEHPCEHECGDFRSLVPHLSDSECDTKDLRIDGFDALLGITNREIKLQLRLHNIFAFPISVDYVEASLWFDDPDGVNNWFSTLAPGMRLPIVRNVQVPVEPRYRLAPGEREFSDDIVISLGQLTGDTVTRLIDEAANHGRLCLHMFFTIELQIDGSPEPFPFTLPLSVDHYSAIGLTDCKNTGECTATKSDKIQVASFSADDWSIEGSNNDASFESGGVALTNVDNENSKGSAWYKKTKVFLRDSFTVEAEFSVVKGPTCFFSCWPTRPGCNADGWTFTFQTESENALGAAGSDPPGFGYRGIGKSVAVASDVYGTNEFDVFENGATGTDDWTLSSACDCDDGDRHTMAIEYDFVNGQLSVYIDDDRVHEARRCKICNVINAYPYAG